MSNQVIPFPLEQSEESRLTIKDSQYLTIFALAAIKALAETGRSSAVIWEGRPPALPYETDTWDLMKVENEFSLPMEMQRRINIIRNKGIPIKQILIAHEHPSRLEMQLEQMRLKEQKQLADTRRQEEALRRDQEAIRRKEKTDRVLKAVYNTIIAVSTIVAAVAVVAALATMLVPALIGLVCIGALAVGLGYDPVVVCILDDGSESWLMAGYWYE